MHPSKANKRITGMSFVRDFGHGRWGKDPRKQVQLLMVLAVPDNIKLPQGQQVAVTGELTFDESGSLVVQLHLHPHLVVDTLAPTQDELDHDEDFAKDWAKRQRDMLPQMRIDQVLTTLKWGI